MQPLARLIATALASLVYASLLALATPVHAVSFNFSFTNQFPLGDVDGTVTGRTLAPQRLPLCSSPAAHPRLATHFLQQTTFFLSPRVLPCPILLR
jgi:hypothetical protein